MTINPDFLERIIIEDLKRVFGTNYFQPKALFLCLMVDYWLGQFIFGPLIIAVFRGSTRNFDYLLVMMFGCGVLPSVGTSLLGAGLMVGLIHSQIYLGETLRPDPTGKWSRQQVFFFVTSRSFVFVSVCADTLLWKGAWELLDKLQQLHLWSGSTVLFFILALFLLSIRSFNACHCSPLGIGFNYDIDDYYLRIDTALQSDSSASFFTTFLDAILTVALNLVAVGVSHSLWCIVDCYKEAYLDSDCQTAINIYLFSVSFSLAANLLQLPNLYIHSLRISDHLKLASHEVTLIVLLVGDVTVYRAVWDLLDSLLITDDDDIADDLSTQEPLVKYSNLSSEVHSSSLLMDYCLELQNSSAEGFEWDILAHFGGFFLLTLLRVSSSMTCGIKRETHRMTDGIMVPRYYLTYLLSYIAEPDTGVICSAEHDAGNSCRAGTW